MMLRICCICFLYKRREEKNVWWLRKREKYIYQKLIECSFILLLFYFILFYFFSFLFYFNSYLFSFFTFIFIFIVILFYFLYFLYFIFFFFFFLLRILRNATQEKKNKVRTERKLMLFKCLKSSRDFSNSCWT